LKVFKVLFRRNTVQVDTDWGTCADERAATISMLRALRVPVERMMGRVQLAEVAGILSPSRLSFYEKSRKMSAFPDIEAGSSQRVAV
jgi:hypothetical protein